MKSFLTYLLLAPLLLPTECGIPAHHWSLKCTFTLWHVLMFKSKDFLKLNAAELQHTFSRVFSEMLQCRETSKMTRQNLRFENHPHSWSSVMCHLYLVKKLQLFELPIQQNGNCYFCGLGTGRRNSWVLRPKERLWKNVSFCRSETNFDFKTIGNSVAQLQRPMWCFIHLQSRPPRKFDEKPEWHRDVFPSV